MSENFPTVSPALLDGGDNLIYEGRPLYSRYAPKARAEQTAEAFIPSPHSICLLPSPLLGYGVEIIRQKCANQSKCFFLCVEVDKALFELTTECECFFFDESRFEKSLTDLINRIRAPLSIDRYRKVFVPVLNNAYFLHKDLYDRIAFAVQKEIDFFWKNRSVLLFFKDLPFRNIFRNLKIGLDDSILEKENTDYFVCGAGESLEDVLPFLSAQRTFFRIVAADTALPVLLKSGIIPDFVVVLESQSANISDFIYGIPQKTVYITEISSAPSANRHFRRKKPIQIPFTQAACADRLPQHFAPFPQTGSVGVAALTAAFELTSGKIFIAGLDFCFSPGKSHARGTESHESLLRQHSRFSGFENGFASATTFAESVCGRRVAVSPALLNDASLIRTEAAHWKRVYDCRTDGLPLGLPRMSTKEISLPKKPLKPLNVSAVPEVPVSESAAFFENETVLLATAENELAAGNLSDETAREIDYLHRFFPDYPPDHRNRSYEVRVAFFIKKFQRLLKKINRRPI